MNNKQYLIILILFPLLIKPVYLSGLKYCIDPGHGGSATGAVGPTGLMEKDINLSQAFHLYDFLMDDGANTVIMTRTNDINLSLSEREIIANNHDVDYFISLHHNASGNSNTNYSLCLYAEYSSGNPQWPGIADVISVIISSYNAETKQIFDIGGQGDVSFLGFQLGVLNDLLMPGVLSEPSMISNPPEEKRLKNNNYLKTEAQVTLYSYLIFLNQSLPSTGTVIGIASNPEGYPLHLTTVFVESHSDTSITDDLGNGYYRIESVPPGSYSLVAQNDRDSAWVEITILDGGILFSTITLEGPTSPFVPVFEQPVLKYVRHRSELNGIELNWSGQFDDYVSGYRIYRLDSINGTFHMVAEESVLSKNVTTWVDSTVQPNNYYSYYCMVVDTSGLYESKISDRYPVFFTDDPTKLLIIDGFDRLASWTETHHAFASHYGELCYDLQIPFNCASNDVIEIGYLSLQDYNIVIWFLGDEGISGETFSYSEQAVVKTFLQEGNRLFVTGSEIGWDLAWEGADAEDRMFYENYLKSEYVGDNADNLSIYGTNGGIFEGLSFFIGQTYHEDYPDYIAVSGGSTINLKYGNNLNAGLQYEGIFGDGMAIGKLVYFGFPMETISNLNDKLDLMSAILTFFDVDLNITDDKPTQRIEIANNFLIGLLFPNPTNDSVIIPYEVIRDQVNLSVIIFNVLGQEIGKNTLGYQPEGQHKFRWNLRNSMGQPIPSGAYWVMLTDGQDKNVQRITVIR